MPTKLANMYTLQGGPPETNGRPCWAQKVRGAENLYILAQACKPTEKRFPYVQTLLVSLLPDGQLTEYGTDKPLGVLAEVTTPEGRTRRAIRWTDGTNVTWIEAL